MRERLIGIRTKPIKYKSNSTRFASLDFTMGGANFNETYPGMVTLPIDQREDLEAKFNSGVNRTDNPSQYGPAKVTRRLYKKVFSNANDLQSWRRNKGEA